MQKIVAVDFYDLVWQSRKPWTPEMINELFERYASVGVTGVLWRLSVCGKLLCNIDSPDKFNSCDGEIEVKCMELLSRFDPAEAAVAAGKKHGIEVYLWLTLYDDHGYGSKPGKHSSDFNAKHPEYSWRSRDGKEFYRGVLSYAYDEVVEFRLDQIRKINAYGADGLYLCNRSHSRPPEVCKAMDEAIKQLSTESAWCRENRDFIVKSQLDACGKFGFDPPALAAYGKEITDLANWQRFRGRYFIDFMEKVRKITPGKIGFGLRYSPGIPGFVFGDDFFDWDRLSDGSLVDFMSYRMTIAPEIGDEDFHELYRPTPVKKFFWMNLSNNAEAAIQVHQQKLDSCNTEFDGIVMFEAYFMTDQNKYWDFLKNL